MSKLTAPLLSSAAAGSIASLATYQASPAGPRIITLPTHPDARSPAQLAQRYQFQKAAQLWQFLFASEHLTLTTAARYHSVTAYNLCLKRFLRATIQGDRRLLTTMFEGSGDTAADCSGWANDGQLVTASWTTLSNDRPAIAFDGASSHINLHNPASLNVGAGDCSAAVLFLSTTTGAQTAFNTGQSGDAPGINFLLAQGPNRLQVRFADGTAAHTADVRHDVSYYDSRWHFAAATRNGSLFTLYSDGAQRHQLSKTLGSTNNPNDIYIGGRSLDPGPWWSGLIGNVMFFSRSITLPEYLELYQILKPLYNLP